MNVQEIQERLHQITGVLPYDADSHYMYLCGTGYKKPDAKTIIPYLDFLYKTNGYSSYIRNQKNYISVNPLRVWMRHVSIGLVYDVDKYFNFSYSTDVIPREIVKELKSNQKPILDLQRDILRDLYVELRINPRIVELL